MAVYRLHLVCTQWIADDSREHPETADRYRVSLLEQIKDLSTMDGLTSTVRSTIASVLQALGFSKLDPPHNTPTDVDRAYQFKFVKIMSKSKGTPLFSFFPIQEHPTEYQLRQFGEHMDRSMDSQPDPRTQFDPDAWQRQVLDKIDQDESILVVAPTSAGWVSDILLLTGAYLSLSLSYVEKLSSGFMPWNECCASQIQES